MKIVGKYGPVLGVAVGFLVLLPGMGRAGECQTKVDSYPYAIVLKGLSQLEGERISRLRAAAWQNGKWRTIDIQIDEVNQRGDFVLSGGLPFTARSDDGYFDNNDELVLRGRDLGDDFPFDAVKSFKPAESGKSWKLRLCDHDDYLGTALLYRGSEFISSTSKTDVRFDEKTERIKSETYEYQFRRDQAALLGQVFIKQGNELKSVFADSAFKMILNLPWWSPNFVLTQDTFLSTVESWQEGTIRTIVAVGVKFKGFMRLFDLHLFSELVFYANRLQIPTVIEFKFSPNEYLKPGSGLAYALSFAKPTKWMVEANIQPMPTTPPTKLEEARNEHPTTKFVASGHSELGGFSVRAVIDEKAARLVPPPFLIREDMFKGESWTEARPWLKDLEGDLGIFVDFSGVRKDTYDFGLDLVLSSKAHHVPPATRESIFGACASRPETEKTK